MEEATWEFENGMITQYNHINFIARELSSAVLELEEDSEDND